MKTMRIFWMLSALLLSVLLNNCGQVEETNDSETEAWGVSNSNLSKSYLVHNKLTVDQLKRAIDYFNGYNGKGRFLKCAKNTSSSQTIAEAIIESADRFGIDRLIFASMIAHESSFCEVTNRPNGKGLTQLTKPAVKEINSQIKIKSYFASRIPIKTSNYLDAERSPSSNRISIALNYGAAYFKLGLAIKGGYTKALSFYNASSTAAVYPTLVNQKKQKIRAYLGI